MEEIKYNNNFEKIYNMKTHKYRKIDKIIYTLPDKFDIMMETLYLLNVFNDLNNNDLIFPDINWKNKKHKNCALCNRNYVNCIGHLGSIKLEFPFYNPLIMKESINVVNLYCIKCKNIIISNKTVYRIVKQYIINYMNYAKNIINFEWVIKLKTNFKKCYSCYNYLYKLKMDKCLNLIILEKYWKNSYSNYGKNMKYCELNKSFSFIIYEVLDVMEYISIIKEFLYPINSFILIDVRFQSLFSSFFIISPVNLRYNYEAKDNLYIENIINTIYKNILKSNFIIKKLIVKNLLRINIIEIYRNSIQKLINLLILPDNSKLIGLQKPRNRSYKGLINRIAGKQGRFRKELLGKRVEFVGRSVISPNPYMSFIKSEISYLSKNRINISQKVNYFVYSAVKKSLYYHGLKFPSITFITVKRFRKKIFFKRTNFYKRNIQNNNTIEREVLRNDIVLINRQPSLHKLSFLEQVITFSNKKTVSFNPLICFPLNADFDGDEINLHFLQDSVSKSEGIYLLNPYTSAYNKLNNKLYVSLIQDFILFNYIVYYDKNSYTKNQQSPKTISHHILETNKISIRIRQYRFNSNKDYSIDTNQNYSNVYSINFNVNSNKKHIEKLILETNNNYIYTYNLKSKIKIFKTANLSNTVSLGYKDLIKTSSLSKIIGYINKAYSDLYLEFISFNFQINKSISFQNYYSVKSNQAIIFKAYKTKSIESLFQSPEYFNSLFLMLQSQSKGSIKNLIAINLYTEYQALVLKDNRLYFSDLFYLNTKKSIYIENNNYINSSLMSGLKKSQILLYARAGREGIVESATRASDTGYLSRKLQLSLVNTYVHNDHTIRDCNGILVDFNIMNRFYCILNSFNTMSIWSLFYQIIKSIKLYGMYVMIYPTNVKKSHIEITSSRRELFYGLSFNYFHAKNNDTIGHFENKVTQDSFGFIKTIFFNQVESLSYIINKLKIKKYECLNSYFLLIGLKIIIIKFQETSYIGNSVGINAAQTVSEPCTQISLKSFHHSGSLNKNITKEFNKIKEILNTSVPKSYFNISLNVFCDLLKSIKINILKPLNKIESKRRLSIKKVFIMISIDQNASLFSIIINILFNRKPWKKDFLVIKNCANVHGKKNSLIFKSNHISNKINASFLINLLLKLDIHSLLLNKTHIKAYYFVKKVNLIYKIKIILECKLRREYFYYLQKYGIKFIFHSIDSSNIILISILIGIEGCYFLISSGLKNLFSKKNILITSSIYELISNSLCLKGKILGITITNKCKYYKNTSYLCCWEKITQILKNSALLGKIDDSFGLLEQYLLGHKIRCGTGAFEII
uniref:DNA-directed RNA polymerase subunit n=1 Tax=Amorphochlora amoebiformis TaxID=1561963 RepID=A0A6T6YNQ1_9EUKA|mmetsp:Transcript_5298/g.8007  ORF Transcript_5298/g.8007 Transcript_5298/m.8007 type:complete len:1311 (+) Transcript_5298:60-3992(+)